MKYYVKFIILVKALLEYMNESNNKDNDKGWEGLARNGNAVVVNNLNNLTIK